MSLLHKSLKIIASAPQPTDNKEPFSPDPPNPWGPQLVDRPSSERVRIWATPFQRCKEMVLVAPLQTLAYNGLC